MTRYRRLATLELPIAVPPHPSARYSLLSLVPETGRRHQLRRHMKHIAHPLAGDTSYGKGEHNRVFRTHFDCNRLLLHSRSLGFDLVWGRHPQFSDRPWDRPWEKDDGYSRWPYG